MLFAPKIHDNRKEKKKDNLLQMIDGVKNRDKFVCFLVFF